MGKLSLIVLLIIGWFSLASYWYVCEIGDYCGSDGGSNNIERLSQSSSAPDDQAPSSEKQDENIDTDKDGLLDSDEDANGNGQVDSAETDPNKADTDGDNFNDKQEIDAGTDPLDSTSSPSDATDELDTAPPAQTTFSEDVFFQPDSSSLTSDTANQDIISGAVAFAKDNTDAGITLTGFTASLASEVVADDKVLASSRAETVQESMINAGIDASRITIDAQGDTDSSSPATSRRVTIDIN